MDSRAKVDQAVFDFLRPRLKRHREETTELARHATNSIAKVNQQAEDSVSERRRQLIRAQEALRSCEGQEDADCSGYRRQVALAQRALEDALQGREIVRRATGVFQTQQRKYSSSVEQQLLRAEKIVRTADERTINYQRASQHAAAPTLLSATQIGDRSTGFGGSVASGSASPSPDADAGLASTPAWQHLPGVTVPASFPPGFAAVPLNLIANDNPVTSSAEFDAGQNVAELRWAAEALLDVVLPAFNTPDPLRYLQERDARENLTGDRSYSGTYSGFFSPNSAMRVSPLANGTFDLTNGRHRLWLLSRAGATHAPALVSGGHS